MFLKLSLRNVVAKDQEEKSFLPPLANSLREGGGSPISLWQITRISPDDLGLEYVKGKTWLCQKGGA